MIHRSTPRVALLSLRQRSNNSNKSIVLPSKTHTNHEMQSKRFPDSLDKGRVGKKKETSNCRRPSDLNRRRQSL